MQENSWVHLQNNIRIRGRARSFVIVKRLECAAQFILAKEITGPISLNSLTGRNGCVGKTVLKMLDMAVDGPDAY